MPTKPIMHAWPQEIWESTRLLSHTFRYCDQWIHSAVFYGPAKGAETVPVRNQADSILERITQQLVLGLRGKRFITGDFNQLHGLLQQAQIWAQLGWTEAQDLEFARTGKLPANTCKNSQKRFHMDHTVLALHPCRSACLQRPCSSKCPL